MSTQYGPRPFEEPPAQDRFWAGVAGASSLRWAATSVHRVLMVEQDVALTKFLARRLAGQHFSVESASNVTAALGLIAGSEPDLVLLDLDFLPDQQSEGDVFADPAQGRPAKSLGVNGFHDPGVEQREGGGLPLPQALAFLESILKAHSQLPVVVLSGGRSTGDLVKMLEAGADDFVMKPFSFIELVARMRAVLRRTCGLERDLKADGRLEVNLAEYRVERNGRSIDLTRREFAILETLIKNAGRPVSRELLMEEVWKAPLNAASNIVDVYMKYLRDKIDLPGEAKLIRTVRGVGYALIQA